MQKEINMTINDEEDLDASCEAQLLESIESNIEELTQQLDDLKCMKRGNGLASLKQYYYHQYQNLEAQIGRLETNVNHRLIYDLSMEKQIEKLTHKLDYVLKEWGMMKIQFFALRDKIWDEKK